MAPKSPSLARIEAFLSLVAPKNRPVLERARLAVVDPDRYKRRFAARRSERSFDEDDDVDAWVEIVDALEQAKLSCGIDWKFAAADIHWNLVRVLEARKLDVKRLFAFYDEDAHIMTKTDAFIQRCGEAFSAHGFALVELDISSDSYELTVVPWKDIARVQNAAKAVGGKVLLRGPKKPLAAPLGAAPKKAIGKFQSVKVAGDVWGSRADEMNGVRSYTDEATTLVDCGTWPPKKTVIREPRIHAVVRDRETILHRVLHRYIDGAFEPKATGTLLVRRRGTRAVDLLRLLPEHFDLKAAGFVGDLVVLLPTEPTIRGKHARRPLVWNGKKVAPANGLRDAVPAKPKPKDAFPSFVRQGFARTGSGIDVLVWEGEGFVASKGRLSKACSLDHVAIYALFIGVPADGDAFYYLHRTAARVTQIREVRFGAKEAIRATIPFLVEAPVAGAHRTIILGVNRYAQPKAPAIVVWHPLTREITEVPATAFGLRSDDGVTCHGTGGARGDEYLWVLDGSVVKRIAWSGVLGLPRKKI